MTERSLIKKVMQEMGRKGGLIGGKAAAAGMTKKARVERAKKAAAASSKVRRRKAKAKKAQAKLRGK